MAVLDFEIFDCDNHSYQAKDAFNRHPELAHLTHLGETANLVMSLLGPEGLGLPGEHRVDRDLPFSQAR
jgi:hypothetical protein